MKYLKYYNYVCALYKRIDRIERKNKFSYIQKKIYFFIFSYKF